MHLALSRLAGLRPEDGLRPLPPRLGYWPAAVGLVAFTWLELVAPERTSVVVLRLFLAAYAGIQLLGALLYGSRWFERGDPFEAYSSLLGRLSTVGRRADGALVVRSPLNGLDALNPEPGLVAVVCVLLGSTAYDGLTGAPGWVRILQDGTVPEPVLGTAGLLGSIAVVALAYVAATTLSGRSVAMSRDLLPSVFAHSVLPIAVGYVVAHYYSLLVTEGQRTLALLSDPLGIGADWLGTAAHAVDETFVAPTGVATLQVAAVVGGHLTGVIAAHDRAVRLFPSRTAIAGQLPLLALMVGCTLTGLTLLFAT